MRFCQRCLLPETQETISFGADGVCNVCRNWEQKATVNWGAKRKELDALIAEHRGKGPYDVVVPASFGKDSTFTLYFLVKEYGLRPLVVTFDHGFFTDTVRENQETVTRRLGVDWLRFRLDWSVSKRTMLESLKRKGDHCWPCHVGIFTVPMHMAIKFGTPLIVWGEPSTEYTAYYGYDEPEECDERRLNRFVNLGISAEDMVGMVGCDPRELAMLTYPPRRDLAALGVRSVCLGSFIPWDPRQQAIIIRDQLGWKGSAIEGVAPEYWWEKIECRTQAVRDFLRYVKRGYGRTAHLCALDLRRGLIDREEAVARIQAFDGHRPRALDWFLEEFGLSEKEFMAIALEHQVDPWRFGDACLR